MRPGSNCEYIVKKYVKKYVDNCYVSVRACGPVKLQYNDGGRRAAGFVGKTRDCVVRAVAIATGQDYRTVYAVLSKGCKSERKASSYRTARSARSGINVRRQWFKDYMQEIGWSWVPTMGIGTGCKVHLTDDELPMGRLIVSVSRHYTAVIDGVIHDTHDSQRGGKRCVYGYWMKAVNP